MVPEHEVSLVLVVIVDVDIASEKVIEMVPLLEMLSLSAGVTEETVGAVLSAFESIPVVKPVDCKKVLLK